MKFTTRSTLILSCLGIAAICSEASGQAATDVECSKCVDTTDIAVGAVNTSRIKNGTITASDIAPNAISSSRIMDGSLVNADLAPDTIRSSRIKDGTLTDADIANNTIAGGRIKNGTITQADIADGAISAAKLASNAVFNSIILIQSNPADPAGNCAQLAAALAMFDPANTVRTLIKLEPGVYDCSNGGATSNLVMKPFVDIEGSGQGVTRILGDTIVDGTGVIQTAANAELRFMTIENINVDTGIFPHVVFATVPFRAAFVTIISADTGDGANEPIDCSDSPDVFPSMILQNSVVRATGDELAWSCAGGIYVASEIAADNGMGAGTHFCHGSYDETYAALDINCDVPPAP